MTIWEEIHGFTNPGEYGRFLEFMRGQAASGHAEEVEADEHYGQGGIYGDSWFKDTKTGEVDRKSVV